MEIQTVTSPRGLTAWLVEDYSAPMFALRFAFSGGSAQDPVGKEGLGNFVTLLLEQGTNDLPAVDYLRRLEENAIRLGYSVTVGDIVGHLEALSDARLNAAQHAKLPLTAPRDDAETLERVRRRLLTFHRGEALRPWTAANLQWDAMAFAGHPYARPVAGTAESINAITVDDLQDYRRRVFARDGLRIAAVGDITAAELGLLIDELFSDLPERGNVVPVPAAGLAKGGRLRVAETNVPQSAVVFGTTGVPFHSPRYLPASLLAHIVGGNSISSRLAEELRVKRGLAFAVSTYLRRYEGLAVFRGEVATRNETVAQSLDLIRAELAKLARGCLSEVDLETAKRGLLGTYNLSLGSNSKIAIRLLEGMVAGFGPQFFENRQAIVAGVTLDELQSVARDLLDPEDLIISIAGTPAFQVPFR